MKKYLFSFFLLMITLIETSPMIAQNLNIAMKSGLTVAYPLDTVNKLSFPSANLVISLNSGSSTAYSLPNIRKMTFGISSFSIPAFTNLSNVVVQNGQYQCFNAVETVTIAGNGSQFLTGTGGSTEIIAGSKILIYPTSMVLSGGYFHASITSEDLFCDNTKSVAENVQESWSPIPENVITVYPNPTEGKITVSLPENDHQKEIKFRLFNTIGVCVSDQSGKYQTRTTMDISYLTPGLYLLSVSSPGLSEVVRIIKH